MGPGLALWSSGSDLPGRLLWGSAASLAALTLGVLAVRAPEVALCALAVVAAATVIAFRPLYALLALLALRATFADTVFVDAVTAVGGLIALTLAAPRLPMRAVTVPLIGLLIIALPSIPLTPSFDEGRHPDGLYLPVVGLRYAPAPSAELLEWLRLGVVLVVAALAALTIRSRRYLQIMIVVIMASSLIPAGIALSQLAGGDTFVRAGTDLESLRGPFTHPNYFAFYLVVVLTIGTIGIIEARSKLVAAIGLVPLGLALLCLTLTYTRAAWIGFAGVLLLLALLRDRRILAGGALLLVVASLALPGATDDVGERFGDLTLNPPAADSQRDDSWSWRTGQWGRMIPHGLEAPLAGQGFGSYSRVTLEEFGQRDPEYSTTLNTTDPIGSPRGFSAHNDYVKMLVELGFPGLALWVATLGGLVWAMSRARRFTPVKGYAEGGLALVLALAVMAASDNIQGYTAVLVYALAFCGGIAGFAHATASRASQRRGSSASSLPQGKRSSNAEGQSPSNSLG